MNLGLVGWANASGNGGMNCDVASLSDWITHWLVAEHPKDKIHQPYINKASKNTNIISSALNDASTVKAFLENVDGIIYIEHPCFRDDVDIVREAKAMSKFVVGIPMWEWWPSHKEWALQTDILWAVTKFTNRYLQSLSVVLDVQGYEVAWKDKIFGNKWGVNLDSFQFTQRDRANRFVFINGNGGYKLRKASDIVFDVFSRDGAPPLTVYTQQSERLAKIESKNIRLINKTFDSREDVYQEGDVFLFPSYWEGLCHGIYEAQACGGIVITSEQGPMNECGTNYLLRVDRKEQENLAGNKIVKASVSPDHLYETVCELFTKDIALETLRNRANIERHFDLKMTLKDLYRAIIETIQK